jgi:hypothetical protein
MKLSSYAKVKGRKSVHVTDILNGTSDYELLDFAFEVSGESHGSIFNYTVERRDAQNAVINLYTD